MRSKKNLAIALVVAIALAFIARGTRQDETKQQDASPQMNDTPEASSSAGASVPKSAGASVPKSAALGGVASASPEPESAATAEFVAFTEHALARLPKSEDLRKLTDEELHGVPAPIMQAAKELGEVARRLEANPSLKSEAIRFYQRCSENPEIVDSIRKTCAEELDGLAVAR